MKRIILPLLLFAAVTASAEVKDAPKDYAWIVTACRDWSCASAALTAAQGNKDVVAVPTTSEDYPWIILQRVVSGAIWVDPEAPYRIEAFDGADLALPHFLAALDLNAPVMLTVPDGRTLVAALAKPERRRRAVGH